MNFELSDGQKGLKDAISSFYERELPPAFESALDEGNEFPHELYKKIADGGFFGIPYPAQYGGSDGDMMDVVTITEQLASSSYNAALMYLVPVVFAGMFILANGTEEQKAEYLPRLIDGELKFAFAMTEPGAGPDPKSMKTAAVEHDDHYAI